MQMNPSRPQSILFDVGEWDKRDARAWLKKHGYKSKSIDTTERYHHFRQADPGLFSRFATIPFGVDSGIKAIIGFKINPEVDGTEISPDSELGETSVPRRVVVAESFDAFCCGYRLECEAGETLNVVVGQSGGEPLFFFCYIAGKNLCFRIPKGNVSEV
jgi:hypothetical protein